MTLQPPRQPLDRRTVTRPLDALWTVRPTDADQIPGHLDTSWPIPAQVPGCVHQDLLRQGLIPDPFVDSNELGVQWVGETDWEFRAVFTLTDDDIAARDIHLVFQGLDTLASISVNGTHLADTENMHRTYRLDVGAHVAAGSNEMVIVFRSSIVEARRRREEWGYWPSASFDETYAHIREMAASWGWDWGPKLNATGVWRDVSIEFGGLGRLTDVRAETFVDSADRGTLDVHLDVDHQRTIGDLAVEVSLTSLTTGSKVSHQAGVNSSGQAVVSLHAGSVERWWPSGLGAQALYDVAVVLVDADGITIDDWSSRVGFRTVVVDESADDIGHAFRFIVNGVPIFVRGVNWIPDDPLVSRVDATRYRDRLENAVELGVNLVRVWGGGIYESNDFYDTCDELGLLVWQDFLFACAAYPEVRLRDEVLAEARDNIRRLRPHPSLAIWNGNNENTWGHVDWGWKETLDDKRWGEGFYLEDFPGLVATLDPQRAYTQGSPSSGVADAHPNSDAHGTNHDWVVWNETGYDDYRRMVPRFVSEFGWQAPPTRSTIDEYLNDDPLSPTSPGMLHHQKALDGNGKLERGLAPYFDVPTDFDAWHWATQLNQARAIRTGVEHYRSHRGRCMGTIWWQFNDCWPVTSWAVLDSRGRRKPAWFALRAAYAPTLLTVQPRGGGLALIAVNDTSEVWADHVAVQRLGFDGKPLANEIIDVRVPPHDAVTFELPVSVAVPVDASCEVLTVSGEGAERAEWFFAPDRELALTAPELAMVLSGTHPHSTSAEVTASNLVRDLTVLSDLMGADRTVDRQLDTLLPGESIVLEFSGPVSDEQLAQAVVRTANDLVHRPAPRRLR